MKMISIFNHVLGPVMRGPSSSHTAGAFHIGSMARSLLGETPRRAVVAFDPRGSFAVTYAAQGADRSFAMGLLGKSLTDDSFFSALEDAPRAGTEIAFEIRELARPDHPNAMEIELTAPHGRRVALEARSIGGGEVEITRIDGREALFRGAAHEVLVEIPNGTPARDVGALRTILGGDGLALDIRMHEDEGGPARLAARRREPLPPAAIDRLERWRPGVRLWQLKPVYHVQSGQPLFTSAQQMKSIALEGGLSLGRLALAYESRLLGLRESEVIAEALRRYEVMARAAERGLAPEFSGMQFLSASAGAVFRADAAGRLATQSLHTRAAARAMAVMHVDATMGVVCAAPTGGSAGVIPGALLTLAEARSLKREQIALSLLAAGAIGLIIAQRATFAAEVAGCQVEIGAAGAMAAAAVVDAVGGSAALACDAAAISLQNTMGLVCDLVHGAVEIPCHSRNAAAAAAALVNADLVLGGYQNPIGLDETIDAVSAVGRAMPPELRCTSKGGIAVTPSALAMKRCGGCPNAG